MGGQGAASMVQVRGNGVDSEGQLEAWVLQAGSGE